VTKGSNNQDDDRLNEIILAYMDALRAGRKPDRRQLLAAHADIRAELEAFFAGHDAMERLAAPLREATKETSLSDPGSRPEGGGGLGAPRRAFLGASHGTLNPSTDSLGQLGEFRLLREVGRGGMGVVYEAEQLTLRRRVALKVLPFAAAIDPRQIQRFKNEALAAANLRHANIVPVHAVGVELGVHYYAMQFIEGQSLATLIEELRRLEHQRLPSRHAPLGTSSSSSQASAPSDLTGSYESPGAVDTDRGPSASAVATPVATLVFAERREGGRKHFDWLADLGCQAALALKHAHEMGIVHRDIKPANLLLDPPGQLWITDFGLAQVNGDAGLTLTGELLGTLRYASPEQALARRGLVDARTDIYSLGATLYELLTLRPIFQGQSRNELLRQIADEEPTPPRSIQASVPVELETIILKALAKEPQDRYTTAQEFADDLKRFIEDRPILARRPALPERLRKWARRHPGAVGTGVLVLILATVGSLVSTALIHSEQLKTRGEQLRAEKRAEEAEARFRLARESVDELIQVSEEELAEGPGTDALRKRLLTTALAYYKKLIDQRRDDPTAQADLLDTKKNVEKILGELDLLRASSQVRLLSQPAVLDDLELDDTQRDKVKTFSAQLVDPWVEKFQEIGQLSLHDRRRRAVDQARAKEASLHEVLTEDQRRRLRQIGLQSDVASTLRQPDVALALRLTNDQRAQIRHIEEEAFAEICKRMMPGMHQFITAGPKTSTRSNERILAELTEEQTRKWREMTGKPFTGPIMPFSFPFGPRWQDGQKGLPTDGPP
jgi:serine/threonine protein kinase